AVRSGTRGGNGSATHDNSQAATIIGSYHGIVNGIDTPATLRCFAYQTHIGLMADQQGFDFSHAYRSGIDAAKYKRRATDRALFIKLYQGCSRHNGEVAMPARELDKTGAVTFIPQGIT